MTRSKSIWLLWSIVGGMVIEFASHGDEEQRKRERHTLAHAQAMVAFAHYKTLERIEFLLAHKCYDAALTEARGHKNAELVLLSENLAATGNDPGLMEYIKVRDPKVVQVILSRRLPDLRPFTTECP